MKLICKTKRLLMDNSGETMVEVLVAFTLLSIMLIVFAQGLSWATISESKASQSRREADEAMLKLQQALAGKSVDGDGVSFVEDSTPISFGSGANVYVYTYTVDGCRYVVYKPYSSTQTNAGG